MVTEDYVSYETAKLLKEKGFDWRESPFYSEQDRDEWRQNNSYTIPNMLYDPDLPFDSETLTMVAPHVSIQMAMKWLREVHKIAINIGWGEVFEENYQWWCIILNQNNGEILRENEYHKTYEEACETAIRYCLENLI